MYLPTFWKLTAEATAFRMRHVSGYLVPVSFLGMNSFFLTYFVVCWIMYPSLYNWTFSCLIPPPRGVPKRQGEQ
ncbi:UNKNOWN [Stylonychia lemnae]|uniref:Uncharacterized protein n=1 Tax=Stylonychia lemnae TaxID=5949 RepID=A0A077ZVL7_STYLE|nr:UNKNOWN [Stylonychia lemnae]|eukprot:CDW73300.1 UNKNOWN [Stylonychia lemnae]